VFKLEGNELNNSVMINGSYKQYVNAHNCLQE